MGVCRVAVGRLGTLPTPDERLLSSAEVERARRYRRAGHRAMFVAGAVLARVLAGHAAGVAPHRIELDRTCPRCGEPHGKPTVVGAPAHVSISHSGDLLVVAASTAGPLGVDIEHLDGARAPFTDLLAEIGTAEERRRITSHDGFVSLWTRKEAVLKATGDGLLRPMADVDVSLPPAPPVLRSLGGEQLAAQMVELEPQRLDPDGRYRGTLAVLTDEHVEVEYPAAADVLS